MVGSCGDERIGLGLSPPILENQLQLELPLPPPEEPVAEASDKTASTVIVIDLVEEDE